MARPGRAGAAVGLGQDGARRIRARDSRRAASSSCRPAAPRSALADAGLAVTDVGSYTGFPEMLDGRVKTLHPKVHGGILARRDLPAHAAALREHDIPTIDLVVVNLYPFRETVAKPGCTLEDAIENIDIGGPSMVRAAAKNWPHVGVVVDPADYPAMLAELRASGGALSDATRFALDAEGVRAHGLLRRRDRQLADRARCRRRRQRPGPTSFHFAGDKVQDMRYGENPHQGAAFYRDEAPAPGSDRHVPPAAGQGAVVQQHRRQRRRVGVRARRSPTPACVIVKHANPCGVAIAATPLEPYRKAFATDPDVGVRRHHRVQPAGRRRDASKRSPRSSSKC